ncbi:MAG: alpha/beta hydrolase [Planctomycetaceae bacterium]
MVSIKSGKPKAESGRRRLLFSAFLQQRTTLIICDRRCGIRQVVSWQPLSIGTDMSNGAARSSTGVQSRILEFECRGERCAGTLYSPDGDGPHPGVVMAHGFAAERHFALPAFAERFAAAGTAVLLFDYRGFGESDGQPRHVVSYKKQRQVWRAAFEFAKTIEGVDPSRIALWGSSYSGGHVIVTAAEDPDVAAIIAQVPMVDGRGTLKMVGAGYAASAALRALWDLARAGLRLPPYYVPVFAPPGEFAALNLAGCAEGYRRLLPPDTAWENRFAAREFLAFLWNRPITFAARVRCPALIVSAKGEQLFPPKTVHKAARLMTQATLIESEGDHFGVYFDEEFERLAALQTDFLREHLLRHQEK